MTSKEQDMVRKKDGKREIREQSYFTSAFLVELKKMVEKNTTPRMTNPEFAEEQANEDGN